MVPVGQFPCASAQTSPVAQQVSLQQTGKAVGHQSYSVLAGQQTVSVFGAQDPNSFPRIAVGGQHLVSVGHEPPP